MKYEKLKKIGEWLNTQGYGIDLEDDFWMEEYDWFEHKTRDICELLNDYHTEQLSLGTVSQQRELLSAFQKKWNKYDDVTKIRNKDIDAYIKGNL